MTSLTAVARHLLFIRETDGPNRGAWVEMLQRFAGGNPGDSWCADFVSFVEDIASLGHPVSRRSGSCQAKLDSVRGRVVTVPAVDDLYFFINDAGRAHHVGIVTSVGTTLSGIAGNTSADGASSNGTGVFEHVLTTPQSHIVFVRLT